MSNEQNPNQNQPDLTIAGGGRLGAYLRTVSEGELPVTKKGVNVGVSKYVIFFPTIQRVMGLEVTITARQGKATAYTARLTEMSQSHEVVMRQLYNPKG